MVEKRGEEKGRITMFQSCEDKGTCQWTWREHETAEGQSECICRVININYDKI